MVTRIQFGLPGGADESTTLNSAMGSAAESAAASVKVAGTSHSINAATGEMRSQGILGYNAMSEFDPGSQDVMNTAIRHGSPVRGDLLPTDVITVHGQNTQVQVAERLGYIRKVAGTEGRYEAVPFDDAGSAPRNADPQDHDDIDGYTPEGQEEGLSDPGLENTLAGLAGGTYAGTQVAVLQDFVESGEISDGTLGRAASELHMEPAELQATLGPVYEAFRSQAEAAVRAAGADDAEDFFTWARVNEPQAFRAAMMQQGMERSTKGYTELYRGYVQSIGDSDPEAVLNADFGRSGITARRADNGTVVLIIPGSGEVPYATAVRSGLISVKGA